MKIKRNINGQEMEFELTFHELMYAHEEYEFECMCEDIKMSLEENDGIKWSDDKLKRIAKIALNNLHKDDCYYDAFWNSVWDTLDEYK